MITSYTQHYSLRSTPQFEPIPGSNQICNSAGGYAFAVDDWTQLDRFLILGSEGGSYYATARKLTVRNAEAVRRCVAADGPRAVARIAEVSEAGRAPKNDPAIFALALAAAMGDVATRTAALAAVPRVCRIGTHLFAFVQAVEGFRGWGRGLKRAVAAWYAGKEPQELAYQLAKYQCRGGWSHRDLLRLCHVKLTGTANDVARWAVGRGELPPVDVVAPTDPLALLVAVEAVNRATTVDEVVRLVRDYGLVRECVPTRWLSKAAVWDALLERMPLGALVRNLATMTRIGLLSAGSEAAGRAVESLGDSERLRRSRLHPVSLLTALRTYAAGQGVRGAGRWAPVPAVSDALDAAFYAAFAHVEPTNKRWLLALDVSGSMGWSMVAGVPNLSAREASAAMALVTAGTESAHEVVGFTGRGHGTAGAGVEPLPIRRGQRLDAVTRFIDALPMGPTDCALPMLYAQERKLAVDVFVVYTDSETWHGDMHPAQALRQYREKTGIPAKLVVMGMVANEFSIADPDDAGMLDVVGFDTAVPQLLAQFAVGNAGNG
ncbi:TROVE domain-containing protein [Gemmata sp. JC717]|uniref:TROVE domain-containing protein n=1 Tax=Gemmata algarum TaxID=2975278 RepID=UPI0021BB62E7|nr:TROVE domain-containing protein [Gemmata algarum]MDY3554957.1 TROVE domain-containing protein [Gemmata algarum]